MTDKKNARIHWVDQAKGIATILVVLGHVLTNGMSSGIVTQKSLALLINLIYSFHMPLFFFISGYLQSVESAVSVRVLCQKFKRNLMDLAIPYMIFTYAYLLIKMVFGATSAVINQVSFFDFIAVLFIPAGEYWFLYALILFITVAFVLKLVCCVGNKEVADKAYIVGAAVLVFAAIYFGMSGVSSKVGVIRASHQAVYYFAGMFTRILYDCQIVKHRLSEMWKLCVLIVVLLCLYGVKFALFVNHAAIDLAIALAMILLFTGIPAKTDNVFAALGKTSLPIYLLHVFVVVLCRILLQKLGINNAFAYVLASTVISIVIPYVAYQYIIVKNKCLLFLVKPSLAIKMHTNRKIKE